jgi:two-component system response regulator HydG
MGQAGRILVVDDEPSVTEALELILGEEGHEVRAAHSMTAAAELLRNRPFDLVITDLRLPDATGLDLLAVAKDASPETEVILMSAHGSLDISVEALSRGAFYYLEKPFTPGQVLAVASRALEFGAAKAENRFLKRALAGEADDFGLVGHDPKVRQIREVIRTAAPSDASVLIEGETGTGKELIAAAFHAASRRAALPFVRINCAAIPSELIESELFGYRKGASTGADRDKRGLLEAAAGGTLFLDEIAELPVYLQTKLLRVLQERRVRRLGDEQEIAVDFRLLCSTSSDTAQMIQDGTLRKDLYFRASTIKVRVPPLRERGDDVAVLARHFLARYAEKYQKQTRDMSRAARALLAGYDWPGNVRELESVVEHAVIFSRGDEIEREDLPEHLHAHASSQSRCVIPPHLTMDEIEREAIAQTLERTGGDVKKTAQILDYHRPTLYRKLKKFGLVPADRFQTDGADAADQA